MSAQTLYDKLWNSHVVREEEDGTVLLYIDRHLVHEVTSPQAFEGLKMANRKLWRIDSVVSTADHNTPTGDWDKGIQDPISKLQVDTLDKNIKEFGALAYFPFMDKGQGIVHVMGPEQGATLPGMTVVCGDSHTSTHGAFGALAHGIGTSEVEHTMATQCITAKKSKSMLIAVEGRLKPGVTAKDVALYIIGQIGTAGGTGAATHGWGRCRTPSRSRHSPRYRRPSRAALTAGELAVATNVDVVGNQTITVLRVALPKSGTTSVKIPGSDIVPKRGEYLASPALAKRIASLPADQLGDRYGKQVGVLSPEAVEGPDSLVAVVGTDLGTVVTSNFYIPPQVVTSFQGIPYENEAYRIATIVGAIAVLVPALLLVGIVTDLGAAQRAERFATLRLIGATPQQVARTAALEIGATTFVGTLAGVALYLAIIPVAAQIMLRTSRFYYTDPLRSPVNAVLAVVGAVA